MTGKHPCLPEACSVLLMGWLQGPRVREELDSWLVLVLSVAQSPLESPKDYEPSTRGEDSHCLPPASVTPFFLLPPSPPAI